MFQHDYELLVFFLLLRFLNNVNEVFQYRGICETIKFNSVNMSKAVEKAEQC